MSQLQRVGVIGGGQLAWMMAMEAPSLGVELVVQTPSDRDPAAELCDAIFAPLDDIEATQTLSDRVDVITFENEFVDLGKLSKLRDRGVLFRPSLDSLEPILDKYHQRLYFQKLGLPVPQFIEVESLAQLENQEVQFPIVMKSRRHGYDGRGTVILKDAESLRSTWETWGYPPVLLEDFIPFDGELAVIAARNNDGEIAIYPIVETQQEEQVCRRVLVPAPIDDKIVAECEAIACKLLNELQYTGVMGIELFLTQNGQLLVNEIAPRTHNSGHFSLDACETSQFAQHLRAVCNLPLGNTALKSDGAVMVNLLGYETATRDYAQKRQEIEAIEGAIVRWYGKSQSYPGRKLGHVTVSLTGDNLRSRQMEIAREIEAIFQRTIL